MVTYGLWARIRLNGWQLLVATAFIFPNGALGCLKYANGTLLVWRWVKSGRTLHTKKSTDHKLTGP
jgi:hypothetical protein